MFVYFLETIRFCRYQIDIKSEFRTYLILSRIDLEFKFYWHKANTCCN